MLKRALTVANIQNQTIELIQFVGKFLEAFGNPQNRGVWFIWGGSGSGKSTFVMMLVKALAMLGYKTLYNLLEEETDDSDYINRTVLLNMNEIPKGNFLTAAYNYDDLVTYLKKRNAPKVVVIDSLTYFKIDFEKYLKLKRQFKSTIFIIVGHAEGKRPRTKFEEDVMYDAKMKIFVDGYQALCKGRTIGKNGGIYTIWDEGYQKLQGAS
jgi:uridine kinase